MFAILSLQYVSMATDGMGLNILTTESAEAKWQKKESKAFETTLVCERFFCDLFVCACYDFTVRALVSVYI